MKLSQRGKDYLKASLAGTIVSSVLDVRIIAALCLSLFFAAVISELVLATASTRNIKIELESLSLQCFKGDQIGQTLKVISRRRRFIRITVSEIRAPPCVETELDDKNPDSLTFILHPKYAGRFSGVAATLELTDPLKLFSKTMTIVEDNFVLDSFPESLGKEILVRRPMTLALGDKSGRSRGSGQEFFAIGEYDTTIERKNILWKKIAASPDERLLVKIRELNIPKQLTIGFVSVAERDEQSRLLFKDTACEGAALLGKIIQAIGCDVTILFAKGNEPRGCLALDLNELGAAIMEMSASDTTRVEAISEILADSDICIAGFKDLENDLLAVAMQRKPALLIQENATFPKTIGDLSIIFDGTQDVGSLINRVVGR